MRTAAIAVAAALLGPGLLAAATAPAQVLLAEADFQDGTAQGFGQPFGGVRVLPDAGPAGPGDFALEATPHPSVFNLFPHTTSNADFLGDWIDKQVLRVEFDAMNPATSTDTIRLYAVMMRFTINRWASLEHAEVPNDGIWRSYSIDLTEDDVIRVLGNGTFDQDFASITRFGFRHQNQANQPGGSPLSGPDSAVLLDNIRLIGVPAPGTLALLAAAPFALRRRRPNNAACPPAAS